MIMIISLQCLFNGFLVLDVWLLTRPSKSMLFNVQAHAIDEGKRKAILSNIKGVEETFSTMYLFPVFLAFCFCIQPTIIKIKQNYFLQYVTG